MDTERKTGSSMGLWAPVQYQSCQTQAEYGRARPDICVLYSPNTKMMIDCVLDSAIRELKGLYRNYVVPCSGSSLCLS